MNLSMTGFVLEEVDAFSEILRPRYTWSYVWTVRLPVEVDPFPSPGLLVKLRQTAARIGDTALLSLISILSEIDIVRDRSGDFHGIVGSGDE